MTKLRRLQVGDAVGFATAKHEEKAFKALSRRAERKPVVAALALSQHTNDDTLGVG